MSCGTSVLWPAAWLDTPRRGRRSRPRPASTSSGVSNSGPKSTSKPMSAKAVPTTSAPRSWPSWPIFAISSRGRRPSTSAKAATSATMARKSSSPAKAEPYTPVMLRTSARWRPNTASIASLISPTVARARAASMQQREQVARHRCGAGAQPVEGGFARRAVPRRRASADAGDLLLADLRVVDVEHVDVLGSSARYWLTPTITSSPRSMRPGDARRPPRSASSACPTPPPWSCRRAPRPPR